MNGGRKSLGFTLIEVLIALTIISIACVAAMRAIDMGVRGAHAMQQRSLALICVQNHLADLTLQQAFPPPGVTTASCRQGPHVFISEQQVSSAPHELFRIVTVRTRIRGGPVLAELSGTLSRLP
ncbi:type II secretion system minor pseudopilin GspI [Orrella marina]|uniref:Type II secretion system protein I n=1 Tax=Orrella marina TaxID=2163011 RepID=A0A2R4XKS3_9BURK|nr:type II secretion system minor pseudopilin GspI [Orrella marina]AWB34400.1 type II secretion system protein GspI [Orrella marina]